MKKILCFALALVLALGIGTAAFAKHGQQEHSGSIFHSGQKHSQNNNAQQQGRNLSFEQHGGGHEHMAARPPAATQGIDAAPGAGAALGQRGAAVVVGAGDR